MSPVDPIPPHGPRGRDAVMLPARRRRAFTLIEMLVSITILSILVLLLTQLLRMSGSTWQNGEASKERLQNVRAITDFIGRELSAALLPVDRRNPGNLQFVVNPMNDGGTTSYVQPQAVFWQAPIATDVTAGDVAEIGYFIRWDTSVATNPHARLCRFFVNPTDTTNFLIYSTPSPSVWLSDAILDQVAPANSANHYLGLFVDNAIGLWVRCLDSYGQLITRDAKGNALAAGSFDSRVGFTDSKGVATTYTDTRGTVQARCALPPLVEISVVLLDAPVANRLAAAQQPTIQRLTAAATNANDFVTAAQADTTLRSVVPGMRAYRTQIHPQNAP